MRLALALALATLSAPAFAAAPEWAAGKSDKMAASVATMKECGRRWQAGKAGRIAAGETWQAFAKDCREQVRPAADECVKAAWPATDMCMLLATGRDQ